MHGKAGGTTFVTRALACMAKRMHQTAVHFIKIINKICGLTLISIKVRRIIFPPE